MKTKVPKRIMDKRGNIQDIALLIVGLFIFGVVAFIAFEVFSDIDDMGLTSSTTGNNTMSQARNWFGGLGITFLWVFGLLTLGVVVSAFFIDTHPIFLFGGGILIFMFIVVVATGLSDSFDEFSEISDMSEANSSLGIIPAIFARLPIFALVVGVLIVVALYAKSRA